MYSFVEEKKELTGDYICLRNLHLTAVVGLDAWERKSKPQPVILSLRLQADLKNAGTSDNIDKTTSYGQMCKDITELVAGHGPFTNLEDMSLWICMLAHAKKWGGSCIYLNINLPKGSLRAENGLSFNTVCTLSRDSDKCQISNDAREFYVNNLRLACIVGVNAHERLTKQFVLVSLVIRDILSAVQQHGWSHESHWQGLIRAVIEAVEISSYETLEALALEIASICGGKGSVRRIKVSVEKPSALAFVDGAGVQMTQTFCEDESASIHLGNVEYLSIHENL